MKLRIKFCYSESCRHVYKNVYYYLDGKRVTRKNKIVKRETENAPDIFFQNTYFWNPGDTASWRK